MHYEYEQPPDQVQEYQQFDPADELREAEVHEFEANYAGAHDSHEYWIRIQNIRVHFLIDHKTDEIEQRPVALQ